MLATFRSAMTSEPAEENGVKGCVLAELGRVAEFEGADGRLASVEITEALIVSLVALASADGRLDAYWTHDRLRNTDADSIHDSVGVWRNFRRNERGDMIADIDLEPSAHREKILWKAKNDKQGIMTSLVFEYEGGGSDAVAKKIISGDFVRFGAATTALLSNQKPKNTMTKEEIEAIVEAKFGELAQAAEAKLAEVEVEADEEDKKDEPKDTPAVMRAFGRLSKASKRLAAKLGAVAAENAELKAGLANAGDVAFARFTAALGQSNGEFKAAAAAKTENDPETAIMAAMQSLPAGKNTRGHAKAHLARTNPELYAKINQ